MRRRVTQRRPEVGCPGRNRQRSAVLDTRAFQKGNHQYDTSQI
jgi:hypothetical protein